MVDGFQVKSEVLPVHVVKACMGSRDVALLILDLAQYRHEWSTLCPGCFMWGERTPVLIE